MTTTTIDLGLCKTVAAEVADALRAVAERHGLTVDVKGATFDATAIRPRVEFRTTDAGATDWARWAKLYDLPADAIGKTVEMKDGAHVITGINPRSAKFPVTSTRVRDGRAFGLSATAVAKKLGGK